MNDFELLLPLGALGFYLFDSAMLLYSNEVLLLENAKVWKFSAGSNFFLAGRRLWMPNPLQPQRGMFRLSWSEGDRRAAQEQPAQLAPFMTALRPVRALVLVLLGLLVAALPLSALIFGTGLAMPLVIALYYATVLVVLAVIYLRRVVLKLTTRDFWAVAFDALACPPFAINLVRKLCLRRSVAGNPLAFAQLALTHEDFASLQALICSRVDGELQSVSDGSSRWQSLRDFRDYVTALDTRQAVAAATQESPG